MSGERILQSISFASASRCKDAVRHLQEYVERTHHFQKQHGPGATFTFTIHSPDGKQLAISEKYWSASSRDYAMRIVQREAVIAQLKYEKP